jgi:cobalt/nickel transport system ATP-binding protein
MSDAANGPTRDVSAASKAARVALIEFDHVVFAYEDVLAVDGVSFAVQPGEMVALTGPNGSGKSTMLRIMNGLSFAQSGSYRFDGSVIDGKSMRDALFAKRFHQRLGYIFQNSDTQLFCPSVHEEIAFGPRQMGLSEEAIEGRVEDMLDLLGIRALAQRAPYRLSGGEKRRVALACIIAMNPDALVLDEPQNGLDEDAQNWLMGFLREISSAGKTVLLTTHHRDVVKSLRAREVHIDKNHRIASE